MQNRKFLPARIGLFVFISLLLFTGAILILGKKQSLFQQTIRISSVFKNVHGLKVGNNVRFTGIEVGTVVDIRILSDTSVLVILSVNKSVTPYIKKDSRATISTEGIIGSTVVSILPGSSNSLPVEPGDEVPSLKTIEIDDIMKDIKISSEKISKVADNLIEITDKINKGHGLFGKMFTDSELTHEIEKTGRNIEALTQNLNNLTMNINRGKGLIGKFMMDTTLAGNLDASATDFAEISRNLKEFSSKLNSNDGFLGGLVSDTVTSVDFMQLNKNLESVLSNLSDVSEKLNNKNNALHKFIDDESFTDSLIVIVNNLNRGIVETTEAAKALQRSGLVRAFSINEEKLKKKELKKQKKSAGEGN